MPSRDGVEIEVEDSEDRRRVKDGKLLNKRMKRRQDNDVKKRLARHHSSDLLRSLTHEHIGGGQHGVVSPVLRASPFSNFPCAPHEAPDAHAYT